MTDMMMTVPSFLPDINEPDTGPFWKATAEHRLTYQVCDACSGIVFFPRSHCTHCTSTSLSWKESAGKGTLYTYSVVRDNRMPGFAELVPYAVAYIDVDEGFRILTRLADVDVDSLKIGSRMQVRWNDQGELSLPEFGPVA